MTGATDGQARLEGSGERWPGEGPGPSDPALAAQGWERRFVTDATRAEEVVDLYHRLGFEVRLEPVLPTQLPGGCDDCQLMLLLQFKTVYTRRPSPAPSP